MAPHLHSKPRQKYFGPELAGIALSYCMGQFWAEKNTNAGAYCIGQKYAISAQISPNLSMIVHPAPSSLKLRLKLNFDILNLRFEMHKKFNKTLKLNFVYFCVLSNGV